QEVNGDPTDAILSEASRRGLRPPRVLLRSDRRSSLGITIELISRLRSAGVDEVGIELNGE
ncbi:hypothetical protein, partial [Salinispira pacifica]